MYNTCSARTFCKFKYWTRHVLLLIDVSASKTRKSPQVKFVGCFDTVKALFRTDEIVHDISVLSSVKRYRQALALNEQRSVFSQETLTCRRDLSRLSLNSTSVHDSNYHDAWFLGMNSLTYSVHVAHSSQEPMPTLEARMSLMDCLCIPYSGC